MATAAHPSDPGSPSPFEPRLSAASVAASNVASVISRADTVGSKIASTSLSTITSESSASVVTGAKAWSGDGPVPRTPVTAADVIKLAKSQIGVSETDGYGGGTKYQNWYAQTARAKATVARDGGTVSDYRDAAWCSMFISWLGNKLHFSNQMGSDAWTVAHAQWFKDHGRWGHKPKRGAVVFFSWSGGSTIDDIDHVGLVVKKLSGGRIKTIEGNVGDAVTKQVRSTGSVVGYGYPNYAK
jgi:hypothetical protein